MCGWRGCENRVASGNAAAGVAAHRRWLSRGMPICWHIAPLAGISWRLGWRG